MIGANQHLFILRYTVFTYLFIIGILYIDYLT